MGQTYSGPQPLQWFFTSGNYFQVSLNSANFHEGSTASGTISFQLNRSTPALSVFISIIGYESVMWKRRVRSGKHTRIVTYRDHGMAWNQRFQIMQSNDSFQPGQYSYPFSFQVPAGIPGSYIHASGGYADRAECACTYMLYAELCMTNVSIGTDSMIGRSMCPIVIMQHARKPYQFNMIADLSANVTTWWWCNKGAVNIKCVFEKDVVTVDESVIMRFNADLSNCKASLKSIAWVLKRKLFLRAKSGHQCYRETDMIKIEVPGIPAGEKFTEDKIVQFDLSKAVDIGTPSTLIGALGEFGGRIQQTCTGQLITVSYELHVVGIVDGWVCWAPYPYVFAPIEILAPERLIMFQPIEYTLHAAMPANPHEHALHPKGADEFSQ